MTARQGTEYPIVRPDNLNGLTLHNGLYMPESAYRAAHQAVTAAAIDSMWKKLSSKFYTDFYGSYSPATLPVWGWDSFPTAKDPAEPPALPVRESETPMVGYRVWDVVDGALVSPEMETLWDGPVMRADGKPCAYDPHKYAWKKRADHCHGIYAHDAPEWGEDFADDTAMGRIEMTGRVVVHERGFRCEAARITALVLHPSLMNVDGICRTLADRYQCDVGFDPTTLEAK